jgi:hypothetical protein
MKTPTVLTLLLLLSAIPAFAQKVYVDYDNATAFSEYNTFKYVETQEDLRDFSKTSHDLVVRELHRYLAEGGFTEVDENPDIYIAYYTADRWDLDLALSDLRYGYGSNFDFGDYWEGGVGTRTPNSFKFRQGTLIVDAWDSGNHELVWRGIATAALSSNPDKNDKKIEKALKKIMKKWDEAKGYRVRAIREMKAEEKGQDN